MGLLAEAKTRLERPVDRVRSYAPASGELLADLPVTSADEVARAVARARKAQAAWGVLPVEERAQRVMRLRDAFAEHAEDLVEIVSRECGKPRHEALLHEVSTLLDKTSWCCKHAREALAPARVSLHLFKHRTSELHYVPRGVVGVVSCYNFPLVIPMASVVEALLAGNACVVKPSEATPLVMLEAKKIFDSTGLPEDLLTVLVGGAATGQALIEAGIDHCVFTGGVQTGKRVAALCGARLIPCTLELGGKAPLLACDDCDLERTARAIVFGGFANGGQLCTSVERVYATDAVYEPLIGRVRTLVGELRQGDPAREFVDVGALSRPEPLEVARRHVEDALGKGARLVCGGHVLAGPGQFFEPTVLADCDHSMAVMREETSGPVVPFMRVRDVDEAIALANDSHLGLNAYVFTKDRRRARRIAEQIEAGSVLVNDVLSNYAAVEVPFGGVKQSGFGRVHGLDGMREMSRRKHVGFDRVAPPARDIGWYPYTAKSFRWLQRGVRLFLGSGTLSERVAALF